MGNIPPAGIVSVLSQLRLTGFEIEKVPWKGLLLSQFYII
jgi:hypothetical protein